MTHDEIKRANLIKLGFQCSKCSLIYDLDHPVDRGWDSTLYHVDKCWNYLPNYYSHLYYRDARHFTTCKVRGKWYKIAPAMMDKFLRVTVIDEGIVGNINYPRPKIIRRQVDIYTMAKELGVKAPLNDYQERRATGRAFVEMVKG